ncbi:alpha/beta fold hydrolase [Cellulomonas sp. NS3]|uniref:alpha/beta fold hydrolase n=1 Tax=Cellulomonas sp. NS3 TaxID=2973977 RepID=UPI002162E920|nr:alpha/beta hydrolase [Cellulomonas sp. NS3]
MIQLSVQETGPATAPSVALLHGAGTSGWMWRRVVDLLGNRLHLLVVDLPGHGDSSRRRWESMADTAAAVADLILARAHGSQAHVIGLSLGGYLAADLAATRPDLVPGAVVSGVNVLPFPNPRMMRVAGRLTGPLLRWPPLIRANARTLGVPPADVDGYVHAASTVAPGTHLRVGAELLDYRLPEAAAASPSRVLAVAGEREHALILQSLTPIAAAFPRGAARVVPGLGHAWVGQDPQLFAAMVDAHVAAAPPPVQLAAPA